MPEIGMPGPGCENQIVVLDVEIPRMNEPRVYVDRLNFSQNDFDILALVQNRADRSSNVRWGQRCGSDLIKERLKKVIIGSIDDGEVNALASQFLCSLEPAKTTTDDHDAWKFFLSHRNNVAILRLIAAIFIWIILKTNR